MSQHIQHGDVRRNELLDVSRHRSVDVDFSALFEACGGMCQNRLEAEQSRNRVS